MLMTLFCFAQVTCVEYGPCLAATSVCQCSAPVPCRLLIGALMRSGLRTSMALPTAVSGSIGWPLWTSCMACNPCASRSFLSCGSATMERFTTTTRWGPGLGGPVLPMYRKAHTFKSYTFRLVATSTDGSNVSHNQHFHSLRINRK